MKKYILIILLVFSVKTSSSQNYIPIPMDSAAWNISWGCSVCNNCYFTLLTKPNGDTLLNSIIYTKFYKYGVSGSCFPCACPYYFDGFYQGGVRQDSINRKIYIVIPNDSAEKILYDFSQNVGDTINSILSNICYPEIITAVDSVLIGGVFRRRIVSSSNGCNIFGNEFIEGMGSLKGLIESTIAFEYGSTLNCFSHNGQTIYPDSNFICLNYVSVNEHVDETKVRCFPNPFKDYFEIIFSRSVSDINFSIYNVLGKKVLSAKKDNIEKLKIHRDNLPSGIYFYQIISENRIISTGKIIAE